jgi:hypothetical protein
MARNDKTRATEHLLADLQATRTTRDQAGIGEPTHARASARVSELNKIIDARATAEAESAPRGTWAEYEAASRLYSELSRWHEADPEPELATRVNEAYHARFDAFEALSPSDQARAEDGLPPVTAHDARMATGQDACNDASHDHSRELTDSEVDAALAEPEAGS